MAKRKRLGPAAFSDGGDAQTIPSNVNDTSVDATALISARPSARAAGATPPIANVAADAATQAALSDVVETLSKAKREGRMVLELDPASIDPNYLMRDRTRVEPDEMAILVTSISERGQQSPIEVVDLGDARYGLISGWRRLSAVKQLGDRPVLALLRVPQDAPEAYLAMIEENEIRVGLSYYERARIVSKSVAGEVFDTDKAALQSLFRSASRAKRSKIKSFLPVVAHLDGTLHFPEDLGERLGLTLSRALEEDSGLTARLKTALATPPADAASEQSLIKALLEAPAQPLAEASREQNAARPGSAASTIRRLLPGLKAETHADGSVVISGPVLTPALTRELCDWLRKRADASA